MPFESLTSAVGVMVISIIVATHGGRLVSHREISTRFLRLRGPPVVAIGAAMLLAGAAGFALALYVGLGIADR